MQIEQIINLERYPIDRIDCPEREALIARGREALDRQAQFAMPPMHRVAPVQGSRRRIIALFCYDQVPGTTFDQEYIDELKLGLPQ